jgi:hypothetical protein
MAYCHFLRVSRAQITGCDFIVRRLYQRVGFGDHRCRVLWYRPVVEMRGSTTIYVEGNRKQKEGRAKLFLSVCVGMIEMCVLILNAAQCLYIHLNSYRAVSSLCNRIS